MTVDPGTAATAYATGAAPDRAPAGAGGLPGEAMAQIGRLVATIKAERHADRAVPPIIANDGREQLVALLRRFIAAREEERLAWEEALRQTRAELAKARAAVAAAEARYEQTASRHERDLADLELLHEHQRSIWNLDRRRFEITISGLADARASKSRRKRARLAAGIAAMLCIGMIGLALAGNAASRDAGAPRRVIETIHSLSPKDLSCLIGCARPSESVQQGRL